MNKSIFMNIKNQIWKLNITIDTKKLFELVENIITNCSYIEVVVNEKEVSYYFKDLYNDPHYRDVKERIIKYPYHDAGYGYDDHPGERIVSYKYYNYPEIVNKLIEILNGNVESITTLFFKKNNNNELNLEKEVEGLAKILSSDIKDNDKIKYLQELEIKLEKNSKTQKTLKKVSVYYDEIMSCFDITEVQTTTQEEIKAFFDYFSFLQYDENLFRKKIIQIESLDSYIKSWLIQKIEQSGNKEYTLKTTILHHT